MKKILALILRKIPRKYLQRLATPFSWILTLFYMGNAVQCPVCQKRLRHFLPYGRLRTRNNALCPNCLSLERHRLLWIFLKERTPFFQAQLDVLHIAPEHCFVRQFRKLHGKGYVTGDIESPLADVKMDIHKIPFDENHFDVVLCNHVMEHVADDILALGEIHRVLKPGGFALLQVPFFHPVPDVTYEDPSIVNPEERERAFGQDDHVRKYGRDYPERIRRGGLIPFEDYFAGTLTDAERTRFGIVKEEVIFGGRKGN